MVNYKISPTVIKAYSCKDINIYYIFSVKSNDKLNGKLNAEETKIGWYICRTSLDLPRKSSKIFGNQQRIDYRLP